jgi:hypothetical protein
VLLAVPVAELAVKQTSPRAYQALVVVAPLKFSVTLTV